MQYFYLNFQFGDLRLFRKAIPLREVTKTNFITSSEINKVEELEVTGDSLPHYFPRLSVSNELAQAKITRQNQNIYYIRQVFKNHFIKLDDFESFDGYLSKFSAKSRSTLKRKVKKAENLGFSHKVYENPEDVEEFHQYACLVGEQTYQKKLFDAAIPKSESYKQKIIDEAEQGRFLGLILFKDEKPCAYLYCPIIENLYVYAYLGYLHEYAKSSPGTVLQFKALEHIYANALKAQYFDFTEGDGAHKQLFATDHKVCCNVLVLNASLSNILLVKSQSMIDSLSNRIGALLDKYQLRNKLKKLIRRKS